MALHSRPQSGFGGGLSLSFFRFFRALPFKPSLPACRFPANGVRTCLTSTYLTDFGWIALAFRASCVCFCVFYTFCSSRLEYHTCSVEGCPRFLFCTWCSGVRGSTVLDVRLLRASRLQCVGRVGHRQCLGGGVDAFNAAPHRPISRNHCNLYLAKPSLEEEAFV